MCKPEEIASVGEVVLRHGVASTDQRLVCTMAMVCKGWRAAVKDVAPAGLLNVYLKVGNGWAPDDAGMPSECMLKLASFSQWLPQHAKLVRKLEVFGPEYPPRGKDDRNQTWFKAVTETVFNLALRSAAAACNEISAQQQLQPLGLQSYSSNVLDTSAVLQLLPVASLTELRIQVLDSNRGAAALLRLTNLQKLEVCEQSGDDKPMAAVLQSMAAQQLSAVTELSFPDQYISSSDIKLLPPHLLRLQFCVSGSEVADLAHLTRLTSLSIEDVLSVGYRFPAQLVELSVADNDTVYDDVHPSVVSISNISSLKRLESLHIGHSRETAEELLQLGALPKLQNLRLSLWYNTETALAASAAWPELRQLQDVEFDLKGSSSECTQLFGNLGKVTWLTRLDAVIRIPEDAEQQAVPIAICSEICKLQILQELHLRVICERNGLQQSWAQDDLAQLSNLTQLTKLHLSVSGFGLEVINDAIVVQLLLNLKQLQDLSVPVKSVAVLPVVAQLSNLRVLNLVDLPEAVQRSGLQYLQGMKSLSALKGFEKCGKQELADFWAVIRDKPAGRY